MTYRESDRTLQDTILRLEREVRTLRSELTALKATVASLAASGN